MRQKLRALLDDRRFLARGGTLAFPCSHLYHQDARFQRKQRPISRQTVSSLKGRDHVVAAAAMAEGLEVTLYPYMIETCADETWQLDHFPTQRERAALDDRMDPMGSRRSAAPSGQAPTMPETSMSFGWIRRRILMDSPRCTPGQTKAGPKLWILTCPRSRTSTRVSTALRAILETKAVRSTSTYIARCTWRSRRMAKGLVP